MKHRRLKLLRVSAELLIELIGNRQRFGGSRVDAAGLPEDAEITDVRMSWAHGMIDLVIASEDFPRLKLGEQMSYFDVTYTVRES